MSFSNITKDQLPIEKFPHLKFQEEQVVVFETLIKKLNTRKELIEGLLAYGKSNSTTENLASLTQYDRNEKEIELIKTDMELSRIHTSLIKKKTHINDFRESCLKVLQEMDTKWNEVMAKGRLMQDKNPQLLEAMKEVKPELYETNLEAKITHYLTIKDILNPRKEDKPKHLKKA